MVISSSHELKALQEAGAALASIVQRLKAAVEPGKNAAQIDTLAKQFATQEGYEVAFEGYDGFPGAVCIQSMMKLLMACLRPPRCLRKEIW